MKNREAEQTKPLLSAHLPLFVGSYLDSHHRPFHMFAILKHFFTPVCFRKTFFHMSAPAKHPFTCVLQQNIIWHTNFPKKLEVSTSEIFRCLKYSLVNLLGPFGSRIFSVVKAFDYDFNFSLDLGFIYSLLFAVIIYVSRNFLCFI